jgi:insertion element IS1 protein InsB
MVTVLLLLLNDCGIVFLLFIKEKVIALRTFGLPMSKVIPADQHTACGKASGQTNHIERWNNTLRQRVGRFVRKTLSFSKCEKMYIAAIPWFIYCYNEGKSSYGQERSASSPLPARTD